MHLALPVRTSPIRRESGGITIHIFYAMRQLIYQQIIAGYTINAWKFRANLPTCFLGVLIQKQSPSAAVWAVAVLLLECWTEHLVLDRQATQSFEYPLSFIFGVANGVRLGSCTVQLRLHHRDERLASLMRTILVDEVVEIDEEVSDVRDLFFGLLDVRGRQQGSGRQTRKLCRFPFVTYRFRINGQQTREFVKV